jgi:hypothetical protein
VCENEVGEKTGEIRGKAELLNPKVNPQNRASLYMK